jgi:hypothetical protein
MISPIATDGDPKKYEKYHHFKSGPEHKRWKGGRTRAKRDNDYYVRVRKPNHPYAQNGYVYEHRLVMEKHLGRYLTPKEDVHHINGIKHDNRIENLELVTDSEHSRFHSTKDKTNRFCVSCGSKKTSQRKKNGWFMWYTSPDGFLCNTCYCRQARIKRSRFRLSTKGIEDLE